MSKRTWTLVFTAVEVEINAELQFSRLQAFAHC